jgi:hypothetical protein
VDSIVDYLSHADETWLNNQGNLFPETQGGKKICNLTTRLRLGDINWCGSGKHQVVAIITVSTCLK